jgi:hypothetical protein
MRMKGKCECVRRADAYHFAYAFEVISYHGHGNDVRRVRTYFTRNRGSLIIFRPRETHEKRFRIVQWADNDQVARRNFILKCLSRNVSSNNTLREIITFVEPPASFEIESRMQYYFICSFQLVHDGSVTQNSLSELTIFNI